MKNLDESVLDLIALRVDNESNASTIHDQATDNAAKPFAPTKEAELEADIALFVKKTLQSQSHDRRLTTPDDVRASIFSALDAENLISAEPKRAHSSKRSNAGQDNPPRDNNRRVFRIRNVVSLVMFGIGLGILGTNAYLKNTTSIPATQSNTENAQSSSVESKEIALKRNIRSAAFTNFYALEHNNFNVRWYSSSLGELTNFFNKNGVTFSVIPPPKEAILKGGSVTHEFGKPFAHFILEINHNDVYMIQIPESYISEHIVDISPEALEVLNSGNWFWEETDKSQTLALWKKGSTICAIVSNERIPELNRIFHSTI